MKKTLLLLYIIIIPCMLYAQYPSFLETDGWCVNFTFPGVELNLNYHLTTEELIDGVSYTKVEYDDGEPNFLREDTTEKKVWLNSPYYDHEILLYDFSLEPGDSIGLEIFLFDTVQFYVSWVDSTPTLDGKRKKIFLISSLTGLGNLVWVEGVGSLNGPFYIYDYNCSIAGYERTGCMLCAYSEDTQIFEGYCSETCAEQCSYFMPLAVTNEQIQTINIISSGQMLSITSGQGDIMDISVYSIDGKLVDLISDVRQNTITIDKNTLSAGLKLISVRTEKAVKSQLVIL